MIPKIIHFCWFGGNEKSPLINACIESWHRYLPDWEFIEWNENNSPIDHPFVKKALKDKKYAFAADYVRCFALYRYGGIYLDTDMEIIKDLTSLLKFDFFSAYEDSDTTKISCGAIGCIESHFLMEKMLKYYDKCTIYKAMPQILGDIFEVNNDSENLYIFSSESFYPYNPFDPQKKVKQLMYSHIKKDTYGIHHWNYSWKFNLFQRIVNKLKIIFLNFKERLR